MSEHEEALTEFFLFLLNLKMYLPPPPLALLAFLTLNLL